MLQPAQVCDILKGVILVICYFMMHYVDYSMMYHLIRGQSVIKLYIIYNMLEVRKGLINPLATPAPTGRGSGTDDVPTGSSAVLLPSDLSGHLGTL